MNFSLSQEQLSARMSPDILRKEGFRVSLVASLISVLVILSFQSYFLFVPFENGFNFLSLMGAITIVGWVLLIFGPSLVLFGGAKNAPWSLWRSISLIFFGTLWTAATTVIKIYGLAVSGQLWASYWLSYPILLFVEWLLPIYYVLLSIRLLRASSPKK
jgi:hypothetical protein